jgi:precorrin-2/cobalt-factor-2 C20-methyltransferase
MLSASRPGDQDEPMGPSSFPVSVIGIGPGDPELLTLRALRALRACDLIVHAGPSDRAGYAFETVAEYLDPGQSVEGAGLAMKRGRGDGDVGYDRVARRLVEAARGGRRAGYLTEGDPMLFGSGSYVAKRIGLIAPEVGVEVIPGVNAVSAAAARLGWPLARKEEIVTICPATYHVSEIGAILDRPGTTCWLKAVDVLPVLVAELRARDRLDRAALVEKVGRPEERLFLDLAAALRHDLSYFSLVLVR